MSLYYESHVTIEPVFEDRLDLVSTIAWCFKFKPAKLLMQKREEDTPERSKYDTFMTGHSDSYEDLSERTKAIVGLLKDNGFKVWRYKIESIVMDSRIDDVFGLLKSEDDTCADQS